MKYIIPLVLFSVLALGGCTATRMTTANLPPDVKISKNVTIPNDTAIAIYVPARHLNNRVYLENQNFFFDPGQATLDAMDAVMKTYCTQYRYLDSSSSDSHGMLLDLNPEW